MLPLLPAAVADPVDLADPWCLVEEARIGTGTTVPAFAFAFVFVFVFVENKEKVRSGLLSVSCLCRTSVLLGGRSALSSPPLMSTLVCMAPCRADMSPSPLALGLCCVASGEWAMSEMLSRCKKNKVGVKGGRWTKTGRVPPLCSVGSSQEWGGWRKGEGCNSSEKSI